jgi:hypothetical protein
VAKKRERPSTKGLRFIRDKRGQGHWIEIKSGRRARPGKQLVPRPRGEKGRFRKRRGLTAAGKREILRAARALHRGAASKRERAAAAGPELPAGYEPVAQARAEPVDFDDDEGGRDEDSGDDGDLDIDYGDEISVDDYESLADEYELTERELWAMYDAEYG